MPNVCGIRFRGTGKVYFFDPRNLTLDKNDYVIVQTTRGKELAQVAEAPHDVPNDKVVGKLKPVVRVATSLDLVQTERYRQREEAAIERCQEEVAKAGLEMKIVGAEYSFDGSRLTFFFGAEDRVDFRELVRELAHIFKTRIELRQIGVRDEAKLLGGVGKCGRALCCSTWLQHFSPISIRMAKQQNLPLSPMEISGACGRLLCCLAYEDDYYKEVKKQFPRVGKVIDSPVGRAKVIRVSALKETARLLLEDGSTVDLTAGQIRGEEPLVKEEPPSIAKRLDDHFLEGEPVGEAPPVKQQNQQESSGQKKSSRSRRSRRRRSKRSSSSSGDQSRSQGGGSQKTGAQQGGGDNKPKQGQQQTGQAKSQGGQNRSQGGGGQQGGSQKGQGDGQQSGGQSGQKRSSSSRRRRRRRPRKKTSSGQRSQGSNSQSKSGGQPRQSTGNKSKSQGGGNQQKSQGG